MHCGAVLHPIMIFTEIGQVECYSCTAY